jgi:hypothetical protein
MDIKVKLKFKEKFNAELNSGKARLDPRFFPAPILAALKTGRLPRGVAVIVAAAKRAGADLNTICSESFAQSIQGSLDPDLAAFAAGCRSMSAGILQGLIDSGYDLNDLFANLEDAA